MVTAAGGRPDVLAALSFFFVKGDAFVVCQLFTYNAIAQMYTKPIFLR